MTIQIELTPEMMERLAAEAEAHGVALEEYAERLLREAIANCAEPRGQISVGELHAMLAGIAKGSEKFRRCQPRHSPARALTRTAAENGRHALPD